MSQIQLKELQKERLIKGAMGLLVAGLCFGFMVLPVLKSVTMLRDKISEDNQRIELFREVKDLEKKTAHLEASLAVWTDRSLMMSKIADIADKNEINVQNIVPRTTKEGAYVRLTIELQGLGTFVSNLKFLKMIESLTPPVIVKELSVSREGSRDSSSGSKAGAESLQLKLSVESFLRQPQGKEKI
jgi:hypothetical protein